MQLSTSTGTFSNIIAFNCLLLLELTYEAQVVQELLLYRVEAERAFSD